MHLCDNLNRKCSSLRSVLPTKQRTLIVAILIAGFVTALLVLWFAGWVLKQHEARVEVEAKSGATIDGMFLAHGHPPVVISNSLATNITVHARSVSFIIYNGTNGGTVAMRAYLGGKFQGEANSVEGVAGWFKPVMGQTKVSVHSLD